MKPQIQQCLKGTALPFISKDALATFQIPLPSIRYSKKNYQFIAVESTGKRTTGNNRQKENYFSE